MEPDFSGYATKAGIKCSDGRTITPDAFAHQDTIEVPLVWQHDHDSPMNVLGYAVLEHRDATHPDGAGMYCYGYLNDTEVGVQTKALIKHGDVKALSIYANQLVEKAKSVLHGAIKEVSVVLAGANKGAFIDNIMIAHSDDPSDVVTLADQAYISSFVAPDMLDGHKLAHSDEGDEKKTDEQKNDDTVQHGDGAKVDVLNKDGELDLDKAKQVYEGFSDAEKEVVHYMVGAAMDAADLKHDDEGADEGAPTGDEDKTSDDGAKIKHDDTDNEGNDLNHKEGDTDMSGSRNQFDQGGTMGGVDTSKAISHADLVKIDTAMRKNKATFKEAVLAHAQEYGIENIELLFPEAKAVQDTPSWITRRMEWVSSVIDGTKHTPYAAVKTMHADLTGPEARAKGYLKGNRKEEHVFALLSRTTRASTIIVKQKLDRDDMIDVTNVNVVAWLKAEMRLLIEEELARAILVGDNRPANHPDKVKDPAGALDGVGIRSVRLDDDLYSIKTEMPSNTDSRSAVKLIVRAMDEYQGSGNTVAYMSRSALTDILLEDDRFGRPLYNDRQAVADKMGVSRIVPVDIFREYDGLYAIIVSLSDYSIGTDSGGELTSFEDFDIDFNQYKYLQEARLSGGLTKPFSALVITRANGTSVTPTAPSFDGETNTITIPTKAGVDYLVDNQVKTGDVVITEPTEVRAVAQDGYYIPSGTNRAWYYQA